MPHCHFEKARVVVDPNHTTAGTGEAPSDPAVPAGDVEHPIPLTQVEQAHDQLRLLVCPLIGEQDIVEVEIVIAEDLVKVKAAHRLITVWRPALRPVWPKAPGAWRPPGQGGRGATGPSRQRA